MAWLTLVLVVAMHVFCLIDKRASDRSIWSLLNVAYHFMVTLWILLALIFAFSWSGDSEKAINPE